MNKVDQLVEIFKKHYKYKQQTSFIFVKLSNYFFISTI